MKIQDFFGLSYCINLDERTDRWALACKEFDKLGFIPERFSAIKNSNPALGCLQSHLTILKQAQKIDQNVLIFEDDVEFLDDARQIIEVALDEIGENKISWDMLYIGGNILKPFYQQTPHLAKLNHCQSTHAYSINKNCLNEIIVFLESHQFFIDVLYADGIIPVRNCYITIPMVAIQRSDYSNIERKIMTYDIPIQRYNKFLVRKEN